MHGMTQQKHENALVYIDARSPSNRKISGGRSKICLQKIKMSLTVNGET
jgi:hypothetical protein